MHLLSVLLTGLVTTALAFPAPISPATPRSDAPIDNSTFCTNHNPALANAINKMCARKDGLVVGNDWTISESSHEYKHNPHPAEIVVQGSCDSDANGPPDNVTDVCMSVFWALCRARIENGRRGVALNRGKNDCQIWFVPGWQDDDFSGYEWSHLKYLTMEDISPPDEEAAPVEEPPTSSSSLYMALSAIKSILSSVTKDELSGDVLTRLFSSAGPTPEATSSTSAGRVEHGDKTSCSHTPSPCADLSRTMAAPQTVRSSEGSSRPTSRRS